MMDTLGSMILGLRFYGYTGTGTRLQLGSREKNLHVLHVLERNMFQLPEHAVIEFGGSWRSTYDSSCYYRSSHPNALARASVRHSNVVKVRYTKGGAPSAPAKSHHKGPVLAGRDWEKYVLSVCTCH